MCDPICFRSCDVYDKIVIEKYKKRFYVNLRLKDGLGMEFTAC